MKVFDVHTKNDILATSVENFKEQQLIEKQTQNKYKLRCITTEDVPKVFVDRETFEGIMSLKNMII